MHGGVLKEDLKNENVDALLAGISSLEKHIENIKKYNLPYVVAINKFGTDTDAEIEALTKWALDNNHEITLSEVFAKGSEGGIDLAHKVVKQIEENDGVNTFTHLYDVNDTIKNAVKHMTIQRFRTDVDKIETKCRYFNELLESR
jgi:formate--tetrahydrofolate ligase